MSQYNVYITGVADATIRVEAEDADEAVRMVEAAQIGRVRALHRPTTVEATQGGLPLHEAQEAFGDAQQALVAAVDAERHP